MLYDSVYDSISQCLFIFILFLKLSCMQHTPANKLKVNMVLKKWWVDFTCRYIYIIACIINRIMSGIEKNYYFLINLFLAKPVPLLFFQKNPVINRGSRLRADHSINITIRTHGYRPLFFFPNIKNNQN